MERAQSMTVSHRKYPRKEDSSHWRHIYIVSTFAFLDAFQFAFFVWTFWPYVQQLDSRISASFVGVIMAVSGVGEALSAPLFGLWTNACGRVLPPLLFSVSLSVLANSIYLCLNGFPLEWRATGLLVSRFLSGAGSGNRGTYFAYVAAASSTADRARTMALSGGGALIGLNVGPAIQVLFTWIGDEGADLGWARISMYTAPAIFALALNVFCVFFLVVFLEDGLDQFEQKKPSEDDDNISTYSIAAASDSDLARHSDIGTVRMDVLAVAVCMGVRAARMLMTANVESIGPPFAEVMFSMDHKTVLSYNSYTQAAVGTFTIIMFIVYACTDYSKWISERLNCLGAMAALLFFHLLTFSWPFLPGSISDCGRFNGNGTQNWSWCYSLQPVNQWLYYISYAVIYGFGLPCLNNSLQSLYSQVLGKGRQGFMQGINQAVGCLSRIFGPILMSTSFSQFGPRANWLIEIGLISFCLLVWGFSYKRLVPAVPVKQRRITLDGLSEKKGRERRESEMSTVSQITTVTHDQ